MKMTNKNLGYAEVRTDKIESAQAGRIHHLRADTDLENGAIVGVGGVENTNLDTRKMVKAEDGVEVALVADPTHIYDESTYNARLSENYSLEEGQVVRAYKLVPTDVLSLTTAGFSEGAELLEDIEYGENDVIETEIYAVPSGEDNHKLKLVSDKDESAPFLAKVVATELVGGAIARSYGSNKEQTMGALGKTYVILDVIKA